MFLPTLSPSMTITSVLLQLLLCCQPFIVRRADVPDDRYLELGSRFPAVVQVGRMGDATLVTPRWLITAAHVGRGAARAGLRNIRIGDRDYAIEETVIHPDWRELGPHDVALIRLRDEVHGITPVPLYRGSAEMGLVATLLGHGGHGTGDTRARLEDGRRRGATSRIDSTSVAWLYFSFDAPPAGTTLEGAPGPGDSGGPAILTMDGTPAVAGVSSAGFDGRSGPGSYGAIDVFTRVSAHLAWIDGVMSGLVRPGRIPVTKDRAPAPDVELPDTPAGRRMAAFIEAARTRSDTAVATFVREHFDEREYQSRPALVPNLQRIAALLREATVSAVVRSTDLEVAARFVTPNGDVTIEFVVADRPPHKVMDWRRYD